MNESEAFDGVLYAVCPSIESVLQNLPSDIKKNAREIRLRSNRPVALTLGSETVFVRRDATVARHPDPQCLMLSHSQLQECFRLLVRGSVYSHTRELTQGFLRMKGGHRAGVCGCQKEGGMQEISSLNLRIAREIPSSADTVLQGWQGGGILIAGPPGSGKTTLLRDVIHSLASGKTGRYYRVAVVDCRGELSAFSNGVCHLDLGEASDVLQTEEKAPGVLMALRTQFPEYIAFDELSTSEELSAIEEGFHTGVQVLTTAHIGKRNELLDRPVTRRLLDSGVIERVALLDGNVRNPPEIYRPKEGAARWE